MKVKLIIIFLLTFISCQDKRSSDQIISDIKNQVDNSEFQKALNDINKLISDKIETSEIYTLKGKTENELDKKSESLLSFQKAILLDKNNYKAFVERAILKLELGDIMSSIEDCNKAMLIKSNYIKIYKTKAKAYELLNDEPNSIIQFQEAIKYGDKSGENYFKLGVLFMNRLEIKKGCEFLSKAGEKGYLEAYKLIKENCNKDFNNSDLFNEKKAIEDGYQVFHKQNFMIKCAGKLKLDKLRIQQFKGIDLKNNSTPYHVYHNGIDYNINISPFDKFIFGNSNGNEVLDYYQTKFDEMSIKNTLKKFKNFDAVYYENILEGKKSMAVFFIHRKNMYTLQVTGNNDIKKKFLNFINTFTLINSTDN